MDSPGEMTPSRGAGSAPASRTVFLLDVDNTLIDNDRIATDLRRFLSREVGLEQELEDVERRHPADHYVLVDDKVRILTVFKRAWGGRVTTVFPRQGHYARDPAVASYPVPDVTLERIGDVLNLDLGTLLDAART